MSGRIILLGYERIIVKKLGTDASSVSASFLFFSIATIFLFPFLLFVPLPANWEFLLYTMISSVVYSAAFVLYVESLSSGEASLVSPLYNFNIFFLLILAVVFLGESISFFKIFGLILLVYGASFLNRQQNIFLSLKSLFKIKATVLMLSATFLIAIGRTIDGFVVRQIHPFIYAFSIYLGISIFTLVYIIITKKYYGTITLFLQKPIVATVSGVVNASSYLLLLVAFTGIEVSIAEPSSMISMLVTLYLARFIFKEKIGSRLFAVLIMLIGAFFLLYHFT